MNIAIPAMAFVMGLTGSLHCAGMCGPIMWIMPFRALNGARKITAILMYHLSRVSMYALLAFVLHSVKWLFAPGIQQGISIGMGILLLLGGLAAFMPGRWTVKMPWTGWVTRQLSKVSGNPSLGALMAAGALNGLLPCGLVYMALSASVSIASQGEAMLMMFAFGLGTIPMLVGITLLGQRLSLATLTKRAAPVLVFFFGCLFILRGMNLGIPYLSPKVVVTEQGPQSSCCHKPGTTYSGK